MASLSVNGALLSIENKRYTCYCPRSEWWRSSSSSSSSSRRYSVTPIIRCSADADSTATQKLGIKVDRNPPESRLTQLGVRNWPKWGCPPSKFPWTYSNKETCYLLQGKVTVTPDGSNESVEIGAGDLVEFPKGMSCTWDVSVAVDKHYNFS
ncbi:uncharacterized protein LOC103956596 [Pyrus x bretschneideri]|uniref:uncharacterized protein LOC103956596 n=1 Tax=Pyrus x bretschneideri TaxID=225117 RepID=UPI00202EE520|nr:uncharacterized protein LOC103956596 [Pyrus x bretschneideri]